MIRVAGLIVLVLTSSIARAQDAGAPPATQEAAVTPPPSEPQPEPPAKKPVHKQAWFWGVLLSAIAVVSAGVALGITFSR